MGVPIAPELGVTPPGGQVQVPAGRFGTAVVKSREGAGTGGDGRHTDHPADALVGDGGAQIGAPGVHLERHAGDG